MNLPKVLRPLSLRFFLLAASQGVLVSSVLAQYGAAPSQTGMFFDDLRMRQAQERAATQSGTRDGDVTYDFDSGVYRDGGRDSQMGQRNADFESAREIARPAVRSGSTAFAARSVGDYTNYSGQYTAPTGFFAPTYTSDPFLNGRRNLKLGGLNVGFGFFQGMEYNDNVNRSGVDPIADVISTTLVNIDANYQITPNNRLSLTTAIGFDRFWDNPELSPFGGDGLVLNVLPGSTVAFDIKAGPVFITAYNRFSVRPAARNDFAIAQNQMFGVVATNSTRLLSEQEVAQAVGVDQVLVGRAPKNSAKKGQSYSGSFIWGDSYIALGYVAGGEFAAGGFGRSILWGADSPVPFVAETYRDEARRSNVLRVRQHVSEKVVDGSSIIRITTGL
jgi:hypothetical protein